MTGLRTITASFGVAACAATAACSFAPGEVNDDPPGAAIDAGAADAIGIDGSPDAPPPPCTFAAPLPPPASVLWAPALSASGAELLAGHGHDDGHGAVGFCAGARVPGAPFFRLVAAGVGVDYDLDNSGASGDGQLGPNFWRDPATFDGLGESGGGIAVYVDIVDEHDTVLDVSSAPELRIVREILDGPTDEMMLTSKPANEFQTNVPMVGGGQRYGFGIAGASDRVINLRLPNNHHLKYWLVFRREPAS
ncbi:MAG: hypothetical protein H6Q90_2776 [Deltaproteobacteria bacterium]|nr:hypothetical protein [Deltaproteobacteria bacterium]